MARRNLSDAIHAHTSTPSPNIKSMIQVSKAIANSGFTSRREAEELTKQRRVKVNKQFAMATMKIPLDQIMNITIDGVPLKLSYSWKPPR